MNSGIKSAKHSSKSRSPAGARGSLKKSSKKGEEGLNYISGNTDNSKVPQVPRAGSNVAF